MKTAGRSTQHKEKGQAERGKCDVRGYQPNARIHTRVYFGSAHVGVGMNETGNLHVIF